MTIIVYDAQAQHVLVDSRHSWEDGLIQHATKVTPLNNRRFIGAYAGSFGGDVALQIAADALAAAPKAQAITLEEHVARAVSDVELFIHDVENSTYYYGKVGREVLTLTPAGSTTFAVGSGASMFRAMYALALRDQPHHTVLPEIVRRVTEQVCSMVESCGGEIEQF